MTTSPIERVELSVCGRPARVHVGGAGSVVLLVHGGWSGAAMHWHRVWDRLAARHQVVAPDLPGLGALDQPPLASVAAYAAWLAALLDALGVARAWCVGNSFGGSVVWSLAGRAPARCAGVVIVDGVPMPRTPTALAIAGQASWGRALMRRAVTWVSYRPAIVARAFADVARMPADLARAIAEDWPVIAPRFADLLVAGDGAPPPRAPLLLVWGAADRLPGTSIEDARRLHARLAGSTLRCLPGAGHFPQLEAPDAFVDAIEAFVAAAR